MSEQHANALLAIGRGTREISAVGIQVARALLPLGGLDHIEPEHVRSRWTGWRRLSRERHRQLPVKHPGMEAASRNDAREGAAVNWAGVGLKLPVPVPV